MSPSCFLMLARIRALCVNPIGLIDEAFVLYSFRGDKGYTALNNFSSYKKNHAKYLVPLHDYVAYSF